MMLPETALTSGDQVMLLHVDHWYNQFNQKWGLKYGKDCCAPDPANFHYIKNAAMNRYLFLYVHSCTRTRSLMIHPPGAFAPLGSDGNIFPFADNARTSRKAFPQMAPFQQS